MNDQEIINIINSMSKDEKNRLILNTLKENKSMKLVLKELKTLLQDYNITEKGV